MCAMLFFSPTLFLSLTNAKYLFLNKKSPIESVMIYAVHIKIHSNFQYLIPTKFTSNFNFNTYICKYLHTHIYLYSLFSLPSTQLVFVQTSWMVGGRYVCIHADIHTCMLRSCRQNTNRILLDYDKIFTQFTREYKLNGMEVFMGVCVRVMEGYCQVKECKRLLYHQHF